MSIFKNRSEQKELLDQSDIPSADLYQNLKELHNINRLLGGYNVIYKGIRKLGLKTNHSYTVLDLGSGGGDTLKMIKQQFKHKYSFTLIGVDIKQDCINYAEKNNSTGIQFVLSDYHDYIQTNESVDIIVTSLFCHHLKDSEIISLIQWMAKNANVGFIINDLHRHPLAYYSIKFLTGLFSKSYLVKNDAPLSVLRGFKKKNLEYYVKNSGVEYIQIRWCWAFRWLIYGKQK